MQDRVRKELVRLAASPGGFPRDKPGLCGRLSDVCHGDYLFDIQAVSLALDGDFVGQIAAEQARGKTWSESAEELVGPFALKTGLSAGEARWVIESWWKALEAVRAAGGVVTPPAPAIPVPAAPASAMSSVDRTTPPPGLLATPAVKSPPRVPIPAPLPVAASPTPDFSSASGARGAPVSPVVAAEPAQSGTVVPVPQRTGWLGWSLLLGGAAVVAAMWFFRSHSPSGQPPLSTLSDADAAKPTVASTAIPATLPTAPVAAPAPVSAVAPARVASEKPAEADPRGPTSPARSLLVPAGGAAAPAANSAVAPMPTPTVVATPAANSLPTGVLTGSTGVRLLPIGPGVWMSATLVRRGDFAAFVAATHASAGSRLVSVGREGWQEIAGSWNNPGFPQTDAHPVVGVSWDDAQAFCAWLTRAEQDGGVIASTLRYRLPTEAEWVAAARFGPARYPWGEALPPPSGFGNFAGSEVSGAAQPWPEDWSFLDGYADRFPRTSPVGEFGANAAGFSDLAGNVLQWCADRFSDDGPNRVLRGSSWADYQPSHLRSDARQGNPPDFRSATVGFRIVLAADSPVGATAPLSP